MSRTFGVALLVWTVFGALFFGAVYREVYTHGHSAALIFGFVLAVWYFWAFATPLIARLGSKFALIPFNARSLFVHVFAAFALGLLHHTWWTGLAIVLRPFDDMGPREFGPAFAKDLLDRLFFEVVAYFATLGAFHAVTYYRRAAQLEASLAKARLRALELQIQPHFLFNTLHAIGGLVRLARTAEAVEMIAGLSDLLRYSLDASEEHVVPLARELSALERYLEIQKIRFPDRLTVELDVPDQTRSASVPALILQPLAENAIRHGIEPSAGPGRIELRARREGDRLILEMFNTGKALDAAAPRIGLQNTRDRLAELYGAAHTFTLENERGGIIARMALPFREVRP